MLTRRISPQSTYIQSVLHINLRVIDMQIVGAVDMQKVKILICKTRLHYIIYIKKNI